MIAGVGYLARGKQGEWALFPDGYKNIISYAKIDVDNVNNSGRMNPSKRNNWMNDMNNQNSAIKMLNNAGYKTIAVADHTVVAIDPVQCSSGSLKWLEEREVPMNVKNSLESVVRFINERE